MSRTTHPEKNGRPQAVRADYYGVNRKHRRKDKWNTNDTQRFWRWVKLVEISWDHDRPMSHKKDLERLQFAESVQEYLHPEDTPEYENRMSLRRVEDMLGRVYFEDAKRAEREHIAAQINLSWVLREHWQFIEYYGSYFVDLLTSGYFTDEDIRRIEESTAWFDYEHWTPGPGDEGPYPDEDDWMDPVVDERTTEFVDWEDLIKLVEDYSSEF